MDENEFKVQGLICCNCGEDEPCHYNEENYFPKGTIITIKKLKEITCEKCACKGFIRTKIMLGIQDKYVEAKQ